MHNEVTLHIPKDDKLPQCPNCGEPATFTEHEATVRGSLGLSHDEDWGLDYHDEHWLVCDLCGSQTDEEEIAKHDAHT